MDASSCLKPHALVRSSIWHVLNPQDPPMQISPESILGHQLYRRVTSVHEMWSQVLAELRAPGNAEATMRGHAHDYRVFYLCLSGRVSTTDLQEILRPEKNIPDEAWSFLQRCVLCCSASSHAAAASSDGIPTCTPACAALVHTPASVMDQRMTFSLCTGSAAAAQSSQTRCQGQCCPRGRWSCCGG